MPKVNYPLIRIDYSGSTPSSIALTATGHYVAMIFQPTPGKTITGVDFRCSASTSGVVDFQLETVTAATFVPSGSLVATGVSATSVSVAANTWYTNSFTNSYAVPENATDYIALVARWVSGSASLCTRVGSGASTIPRVVEGLGTVTQRNIPPCCSVVYSDGTRQNGCVPFSSTSNWAWNASASPDEYGNIYVPDCNQVVVGIQTYARVISGGQTQFRIYDENLNVMTVDAELLGDVRQQSTSSAGNIVNYMLKTPLYLLAGRTYYITMTAMDSNNTYMWKMNFDDSARRAHFSPLMYTASRTNWTGSFTTDTATVVGICPIIDSNYALAKDGMDGGMS